MLEPNKKGKYKKADILAAGYKIVDYGITAHEIKRQYGIEIPLESRVKLAIGFKTDKGWRGYSPVFDLLEIFTLKSKNIL